MFLLLYFGEHVRRRTCENYSQLKISYRYEKVIENLSKNNNIIVMKKDKTHGVGILDRTKNIGKCYNITNINHFSKLNNDPTRTPVTNYNALYRDLEEKLVKVSIRIFILLDQDWDNFLVKLKCINFNQGKI